MKNIIGRRIAYEGQIWEIVSFDDDNYHLETVHDPEPMSCYEKSSVIEKVLSEQKDLKVVDVFTSRDHIQEMVRDGITELRNKSALVANQDKFSRNRRKVSDLIEEVFSKGIGSSMTPSDIVIWYNMRLIALEEILEKNNYPSSGMAIALSRYIKNNLKNYLTDEVWDIYNPSYN